MRPLARPVHFKIFQPLAIAASALAILSSAAAAQTSTSAPALQIAPRSGAALPAAQPDFVLKRLPAGRTELTLRGEAASRSFTVTLSRTEASRISTLQVALLSPVSLLPDRSQVKVTINGTTVATMQPTSTEKPAVTSIRMPAGVLLPGANTIQITSALTHRVDCSVQATYELWAMLDPAQTGFLVPREVVSGVRSIDDLGSEPLAEDGTTRIHVRMANDPEDADVAQAARVVDALVRRSGLVRPVVEVGPALGTGAGFDVLLTRGEPDDAVTRDLKIVGQSNGITLARDEATNRLVVVLKSADVDHAIAALGAITRTADPSAIVTQGFHKTFAELGMQSSSFAGRHYMSDIDIALPPDFLPSNDRAQLLIDGGHSGSLVPGDELVFRVNGTLVSSMPLAAGKAEQFQQAVVELPLRFFHTGHNTISIEGTTLAEADAQCDTLAMQREPRLTILKSSVLDFPDFTHLATLPQIAAAMAHDSDAEDGAVNLYLADADRGSLGAGLTVLANMAATQDRVGTPNIHIGAPLDSDPPGVVLAATSQLPESLATALRRITVPVATPPQARREEAQSAADPTVPTEDAPAAASPKATGFTAEAKSVLSSLQSVLRTRGFFFSVENQANLLPVTDNTLVVAAVARQSPSSELSGFPMPRFTRDAAHWLVVSAADPQTYQTALEHLIADGRWASLGGQAVSFDPKTDVLQTLQPRRVTYVIPNRLVLSDVRPILGGIFSDHIAMSMAVMLLLMSILGVSTHALIRRSGVK